MDQCATYKNYSTLLALRRANPKTTDLSIYAYAKYKQNYSRNRHYILGSILFATLAAVTIVPMLKTIKEQQNRISTLSNQTATLQNKVESLRQLLIKPRVDQPIEKQSMSATPASPSKKKNILSSKVKKFFISNIPVGYPINGKIISSFGYRNHPFTNTIRFHKGIDIAAAIGAKVKTSAEGKVIKAQWDNDYGLMIEIEHFGGFTTKYAHLSELNVKPGDYVSKGTIIALSGDTGIATGPHLHYEVRMQKELLNPVHFISCTDSNVQKLIQKEKSIQWDSLIAKMEYQQNIKIACRSLLKGSSLKENG